MSGDMGLCRSLRPTLCKPAAVAVQYSTQAQRG